MGALYVHNKSGKSTPRPEAINSDKLPPREHPGGYNHLASGRRKYFRAPVRHSFRSPVNLGVGAIQLCR
jgi:hypothetical protein